MNTHDRRIVEMTFASVYMGETGGGNLTTLSLGATDAFLTKDRQRAAETIVNQNAGKKFEEQGSEGPRSPGEGS